jgi:hypothetical protein
MPRHAIRSRSIEAIAAEKLSRTTMRNGISAEEQCAGIGIFSTEFYIVAHYNYRHARVCKTAQNLRKRSLKFRI